MTERAMAPALRASTSSLFLDNGRKLEPFVLQVGQFLLEGVVFPERRAELFLVGVQLLARHQLHELIVAGTFDLERSLDVLELVLGSLESAIKLGACRRLCPTLFLGLFALAYGLGC